MNKKVHAWVGWLASRARLLPICACGWTTSFHNERGAKSAWKIHASAAKKRRERVLRNEDDAWRA